MVTYGCLLTCLNMAHLWSNAIIALSHYCCCKLLGCCERHFCRQLKSFYQAVFFGVEFCHGCGVNFICNTDIQKTCQINRTFKIDSTISCCSFLSTLYVDCNLYLCPSLTERDFLPSRLCNFVST